MVSVMWAYGRALSNLQWPVLENGGAYFHHNDCLLLILCSKSVLGP